MDRNLDTLQIEIKAQANNADDAIEKLVVKLDKLTTSIGRLGKTNFSGFSTSIRNISSAMQGLSSVKLPDYTRLAKGIDKFSTINSEQIKNAGYAMQELGKSLRTLDGINVGDNAVQVTSLAKAISQLGYKSSTQAIDNIPKLAIAMKSLMTTLSTAPKVSQNLIDMTNALAKLSRTGASSGKASASLARSLDLYTASSKRATKSTWSLASAFGKMYASYWLVFRAFSQIKKAIDISSDLTEIQNVVDVTFGDMAYKVEQFAETSIEQFGMSELTLKRTASQFQAMGSAMNINNKSIAKANEFLNRQTGEYVELGSNMADVSLTLTKLTADMASFYNVEQKDVAEDLQAIFTAQTKPLRQYGIDLTEVNLKQWAMTEGLNSNIESMTQAEKTMLRYQYVLAHTKQAQGDFARTANTWANQIRILKQNFEQLGAIIGKTFINMLKPLVKALNNAMSSIIAFAQTIANALGKIFGWKYEVDMGGIATDLEDGAGYADDLADGIGSSAENAKKLRTYLLGIDELNVLDPTENASTSGGSGVSGGGGGPTAGEWVKGESLLEDYKSEIDTLYELGRYISDTLSKAMENIDWESVYEKARGFGAGLADFLNGLISPRLFSNLGKTIANSINTIFEAGNAFAENLNWDNLGNSLATGIDSFIRNWDVKLTAKALSNFASGILDAITSFFKTLNDKETFKEVGQKIVDLIFGIEWGSLVYSLNNFFDAVLNAITDFPSDLAIGFIEALWEEISGQEVTLTKPKWLDGIGDMFLLWISPALGGANIGQKIADALFGKDNHFSQEGNNYGGSGHSRGEETGSDLEGLKEKFNQFFEDIGTSATNFFDDLYANKLNEFVTNTSDKFSEWYENSVKPWFSAEKWEELWGNLKISAETKWNELVEWWTTSGIYRWYNDNVKPWFDPDDWSTLYNTIKKELENKWNELVNWWNTSGIYRWYNNNVKTWFSKDKWNFRGIKDGLVQAWENAIEAVKQVWNKFAKWFNSKMTLELPKIEIDGKTIFGGKDITFIKLPTFATGGFPEDGLFMANHNELVGKFSNGRTVVANNQQIVEGIASGVAQANAEEVALLGQAVGILTELVGAVREGKSITIDGRELVEAYDSRKTRNGYAF